MDIIKVTPEELKKAATAIRGLVSDYAGQYADVYAKVSAMSTSWAGKDNLAFTDQIEGFKPDFEAMKDTMEKYADFLVKSADSYIAAQDQIEKNAKALRN